MERSSMPPPTLTAEQILALAPDPASAKAGQTLASPRKWSALGWSDRAAWGECQGSAREPYRTQIDLAEPAFRCSCPSRKFPCKHGLGLLLLLASQPAAFAQGAPPLWVAEWLAKRDQGAQQRVTKQERASTPADAGAGKQRAAAQARSVAAREAKVAAGLEELGRWLRDLARQGLASAQSRPHSYWESIAARMVDAQAPGLARMVRELAGVPASGEGWQERLLEGLARLFLLIEGGRRLETLPVETRSDVRAAIGWAQNQDELLADRGVRDRWLVLGQCVQEEDHLRVLRTWLWGAATGRRALSLAFAAPGQPLDRSLVSGTTLDADLVFFPSACPLRALVKQRHGPPLPLDHMPGDTIQAATEAYAVALACSPWIERFPLALADVIPLRHGDDWLVRDAAGLALPLARRFAHGWRLLALSGGQPVALFGEWDGDVLLPLSAWAGERFVVL
jgi:SWIM zinc finger